MLKKAFTMLELVFIIVVMGIVASIGANIIINLYENYLKTRSIDKLQSQTEIVLDQIAKRLQYRIKDSVIARDMNGINLYTKLSTSTNLKNYEILEWIGKSNESFLGRYDGSRVVPGWSGFIDLDSNETNSTAKTLKTSGSRLDYANTIIYALSYGEVDLNGTAPQRPAIIFRGKDFLDINQYGWSGVDGNYTHRVMMKNSDVLIFDEGNPTTIYEQYDLAWSAYALVSSGESSDFNLTLHYNYQPWHNEKYDDNSTRKIVLMQNVSTFRFTQIGETIRLKLCINDANKSGDYNFAFCKERVIF
ncbi:MAG: type II secretion system protein [Sulfurospirillum sp.]|nr:type II secretion system protein [Sulfurospirillum sp.]MBL0703125.1 type II secretion system protein [Sulfurospirillum sp.]